MIIYAANTAYIHTSRTKAATEKKKSEKAKGASEKKEVDPHHVGAPGPEKKGADHKLAEENAKKEEVLDGLKKTVPNAVKETPPAKTGD